MTDTPDWATSMHNLLLRVRADGVAAGKTEAEIQADLARVMRPVRDTLAAYRAETEERNQRYFAALRDWVRTKEEGPTGPVH